MANERRVRVEAPLSDAIPTMDALEKQILQFRFGCEVISPKNGYEPKVIHCDVFTPVAVSETEVRREFREFIEKIENRHALKEEAERNRASQEEALGKIKRGLQEYGEKQ